MRRLCQYLAIIATLIALNGCNNTYAIPSFDLASLQDGVTLHCSVHNEYVPKQAVLHAEMGVNHTYNLDEWANKTSHIRQKMKEVIIPKEGGGNSYVYSTLKKVSITASQPIWEREAGEELADLFNVEAPRYVFTYPDGDLVHKVKDGPYFYHVDEWIGGCLLLPKTLQLVPQTKIPTAVRLFVTLTLATEADDVVISDSFFYDPNAK